MTIEDATRHINLEAIKWTDALKQSPKRDEEIEIDESRIREVLYRPFTKIWLYEDSRILSRVKTVSSMFPRVAPPGHRHHLDEQRAIFAVLATSRLSDLCAVGTNQPSRIIPGRSWS